MTTMAFEWLVHIIHATWQATLAAALVLILIRLLPKSSPRLRHAIVMVAIAKFAIPPMLPLPTGIFSAAPPAPELTAVRTAVVAMQDLNLLTLLMLIHIGGIAATLLRLAHGVWRLEGIRGRADRNEGFLTSNEIATPITIGIFRPAILLPATLTLELSAAELRDVLAHERMHIRRRDVLLNTIIGVVGCVWWFHPLFSALARQSRGLREECCDDAVIATGAHDPLAYVSTLLRAASFGRTTGLHAHVAAIAERPHELLTRVRRISAEGFTPSPALGWGGLLAVLLVALALLPGLRVSRDNVFAFDLATRHALHH